MAYLSSAGKWAVAHRHMLALKAAVAVALVVAHYYPEKQLSLLVNLVWLALF
jgi:hypothetical protein